MKTAVIFVAGFIFNCVQCYNSESYEYNGIEVSPLYETIIYSDLADILNEFDKDNAAYEKANNESESDEDVEDLLSEYHHYLEKAHKQGVNFLEKTKLKNKVPNIHHDKFTKFQSPIANKHNDYYKNNFYKPDHKFSVPFNPFNMLIPFNNKYVTTEKPQYSNDLSSVKKIMFNDEIPIASFPNIPTRSCCKDGRLNCKQCLTPIDHMLQRTNSNLMLPLNDPLLSNPVLPEFSDDAINVRIKIDVQLPKFQQDRAQFYSLQNKDKMTDYDVPLSKEFLSTIRIPSPYFNFPIPLNLLGFDKMTNTNNKYETQNPLHKITIHKKKKSKFGITNKKHRKKVITFHNIKIEPELSISILNASMHIKNNTNSKSTTVSNNIFNNTQNKDSHLTTPSTTTSAVFNIKEAQTEENILLSVNITNNIDNGTNEYHKIENSIETEYTYAIRNSTTVKPTHLIKKREISFDKKSTEPKDNSSPRKNKPVTKGKSVIHKKSSKVATPSKHVNKSTVSKSKPQKKTIPKKATKKKISGKSMALKSAKTIHAKQDKEKKLVTSANSQAADLELLFWPNTTYDSNKTKEIVKNITAMILHNENVKTKINMTKDTMRRNHTRALEQAIFGDVDWNDVDAVVPAFISFFGKYIEGALTFCNEHTCHSIKCTKQTCVHRFCSPKDRFNKGHCSGSNLTDSVVSMESIMDLPSNVAYEIVDILEERMVGKLFGKITLCINSKCITFTTSKKVFHKYKCLNSDKENELDPKGHCKLPKDV